MPHNKFGSKRPCSFEEEIFCEILTDGRTDGRTDTGPTLRGSLIAGDGDSAAAWQRRIYKWRPQKNWNSDPFRLWEHAVSLKTCKNKVTVLWKNWHHNSSIEFHSGPPFSIGYTRTTDIFLLNVSFASIFPCFSQWFPAFHSVRWGLSLLRWVTPNTCSEKTVVTPNQLFRVLTSIELSRP